MGSRWPLLPVGAGFGGVYRNETHFQIEGWGWGDDYWVADGFLSGLSGKVCGRIGVAGMECQADLEKNMRPR